MNPTQYMYLGPNRPFGLPLVTRAIFRGDPEKTFPWRNWPRPACC